MKRWRLLEKKRNLKKYFISYRWNTTNGMNNNIVSYKNCSCVYSCVNYENLVAIEKIGVDNNISSNQSIDIISVSKL